MTLDQPAPIAVVRGAPTPQIQALFASFVARLGAPVRVVGVVEEEPVPGRAQLRSLTDGRRFEVFQELGRGSSACSVDAGSVVTACEAVRGDIAALELRLSDHLEARAIRAAGREAERFRALAEAAQARSAAAVARPFGRSAVLDAVPEGADARLVPLCELLLDCYLDLAEREKEEEERLRAQACAGEMIACLQAVRQ